METKAIGIKNMPTKEKILWLINIIVPIIILLIPTNEVFTPEIRLFSVITVLGIMLLAFDLIPNAIPALFLPFLYSLFKLAPLSTTLSPWITTNPWLMLGGFFFAAILNRTGLLKRIAYFFIVKTGGTYTGIIFGLLISSVAINFVFPGSSPIALATLSYGICTALNLGKSKASAGIMLISAIGTNSAAHFVYTPGNLGILLNCAAVTVDLPMNFTTYFKETFVFMPMLFIIAFVIAKLMKPEQDIDGREYFVEQRRIMGKMSPDEKKAAVIFTMLVVFLVTATFHKLDSVYAFVFLPSLMYMPGIEIGTKEDIKNLNFPFLLYVSACMAIGMVAAHLSVGNLISQMVLPLMEGTSPQVFVGISYILGILLNFLLTPMAAMSAFGSTLAQIALDAGVNPYPVMYTFFYGLDQVILPYEYVLYLMAFSFGNIHLKDFAKVFGLKMAISMVYTFAIVFPYWTFIGLI